MYIIGLDIYILYHMIHSLNIPYLPPVVRRNGEGTVFTAVCLFTFVGGGTPSGPNGGIPFGPGGTPSPDKGEYPIFQLGGGTPSCMPPPPCQDWMVITPPPPLRNSTGVLDTRRVVLLLFSFCFHG